MVREANPPSTIRSLGNLEGHPQGGGMPLKGPDFLAGQAENEGTATAHGPALVHTDVAGSLGGQASDQMRRHHFSRAVLQ